MQLTSLRVRNYRTIGSTEQTLQIDGGLSLVGPNNSGKTNLLRAVQLLFTGPDNIHGYHGLTDLTFGARSGVKTSLLATFSGDDAASSPDRPIYEALDGLHTILGTARSGSQFTLSLQFPASDTPVYQFFPNAKQPADNAKRTAFSRAQRQLVLDLLNLFACHYVPSARSMEELYNELLVSFLRALAADAMAPHASAVTGALQAVAQSFNDELGRAGLPDLNVSFTMPGGSLEAMLRGFDFLIPRSAGSGSSTVC